MPYASCIPLVKDKSSFYEFTQFSVYSVNWASQNESTEITQLLSGHRVHMTLRDRPNRTSFAYAGFDEANTS